MQSGSSFETPFLDLIYRAAQVHREHFNPQAIQLSTLMSIKPAVVRKIVVTVLNPPVTRPGCKEELLDIEDIVAKAKIAKERGAGRFCMGAAWRGPKPKDIEKFPQLLKR